MTLTRKPRVRYKRYTIASSYSTYKYRKKGNKELRQETTGGYNYIKREDSNHESNLSLTYDEYYHVIKDFFIELLEEIKKGHKIALPGLGTFWIGRFKVEESKYKPVDWAATREYRIENPDDPKALVKYDNHHTSGWFAKLRWMRPKNQVEFNIFNARIVRPKKLQFGRWLKKEPSAIYRFEPIIKK